MSRLPSQIDRLLFDSGDVLGVCCFGREEGKNASQTKRRRLLVELAVRRCGGMQPAARWGDRWCVQGANRVGKSAADSACQPFVTTGGGEGLKATATTTNRPSRIEWLRSQQTVGQISGNGCREGRTGAMKLSTLFRARASPGGMTLTSGMKWQTGSNTKKETLPNGSQLARACKCRLLLRKLWHQTGK